MKDINYKEFLKKSKQEQIKLKEQYTKKQIKETKEFNKDYKDKLMKKYGTIKGLTFCQRVFVI